MIFRRPLTWSEWIRWCLAKEPWRVDPRIPSPAAADTPPESGGQPNDIPPVFGGRAQAGLFGEEDRAR